MEITITIAKNGEIDPPGMLIRINEPGKGEIDTETTWRYVCKECAGRRDVKAGVDTVLTHDHKSRLFGED